MIKYIFIIPIKHQIATPLSKKTMTNRYRPSIAHRASQSRLGVGGI